MEVRTGFLPDPYKLDTAYAGGQPVGVVEKIVMDEPDPDRLRPYIERAWRELIAVSLREGYSEVCGEAGR